MQLRQTLAALGILIVLVTVTAVVLRPGTGPAGASAEPAGVRVAGHPVGSINGTVTEEGTGTPLAEICVDAVDSSPGLAGFDVTDAAGAYSVGLLVSGDYAVEFFDCGESPAYSREWYNDRPDEFSADLVAVVAGAKTSGIDAELSRLEEAGDANCNGIVDSIDATIILQFVAGLLGALPCADAADVNGDGDITSVDATLILQFTAGLLDSLAVG